MSTLRDAAQQALEALTPWMGSDASHTEQYAAYHALRAALAEPVQEPDVPETNFGNMKPVGWFEGPFGEFRANQLFKHSWPAQTLAWSIPLYLAPPQTTHWQGCEEVHPECAAKSRAELEKQAGCGHCTDPRYAGVRCGVCGRTS